MFIKLKDSMLKNWPFLFLIAYSLGVFILAAKINLFRYNNFDLGKFDLGNMTQMIWNTTQGRFMYLTDYFGTNLPRWGMSHVDPIILLALPFFLIFKSPLTLIFFQLVIVTFSSLLIYAIAELEMKNKVLALLMGLAYLLYPAMGFVLAWTAFHGVTLAIPFFLGAFYLFEKMHHEQNFSKKRMFWFWILLVITMSGKEELPLFIFMLGLFILFFRNGVFKDIKSFISTKIAKLGLQMMVVSLLWFVLAFFVIIPTYSSARIAGYERFALDLGIKADTDQDVGDENYFLRRYEELGNSYTEIATSLITNPSKAARVLFNGDKPENMRMTFDPLLYAPLLYPPLFVIAIPELVINYAITGGNVGTSEIFNHRISMIIPILFLASLYGINYVASLISSYSKLKRVYIAGVLCVVLVVSNLVLSYSYGNPIYLWFNQAVEKRLNRLAFARTIFEDSKEVLERDLEIGERFRLAEFERRDRECARAVIDFVPENASISGPDYLGAYLSMRETYAIFPALYNSADYVIVDVFSLKVVELLDLEQDVINKVVGNVLKDENYRLHTACGNLFIFERVGLHDKSDALPIQESFVFDEKVNLEIFEGLYVVDYSIPSEIVRGQTYNTQFTFIRKVDKPLDDYVVFTTFVNAETGEVYQLPNLPSFALSEPKTWSTGRYFTEINEVRFPEFVEPGTYKAFVGISNDIRTRSIYLGNVEVK